MVKAFLRVIASVLIVFASGVAPEVWIPNGTLGVPGQATDAIRTLDARADIATATPATRFLLDSRVLREGQKLAHVLIPSSIAASSSPTSRLVPRGSLHTPEFFVLRLIRGRAPPLSLAPLNS
jgi:hypothetical protein